MTKLQLLALGFGVTLMSSAAYALLAFPTGTVINFDVMTDNNMGAEGGTISGNLTYGNSGIVSSTLTLTYISGSANFTNFGFTVGTSGTVGVAGYTTGLVVSFPVYGGVQTIDVQQTVLNSVVGANYYYTTYDVNLNLVDGLSYTSQTVDGTSIGLQEESFKTLSSTIAPWSNTTNGVFANASANGQTRISLQQASILSGAVNVPEPASMALVGFGLAGLAIASRRRA